MRAGDDLELFEMANLPQENTGTRGIIQISSSIHGKHGARVKWFPSAPKSQKDPPCLTASISPNPKIQNLNLPKHVAEAATGPAKRWVILNHVALLNFWNTGYSWTIQELNAFIDGLHKI